MSAPTSEEMIEALTDFMQGANHYHEAKNRVALLAILSTLRARVAVREAAINVIARLLRVHEDRGVHESRRIAQQMLDVAQCETCGGTGSLEINMTDVPCEDCKR